MATGDLSGNVQRLVDALHAVDYPQPVSARRLREGDPKVLLPMLHYALLDYSRHVASAVAARGHVLFGADDAAFTHTCIQLAADMLGLHAHINARQFLSERGFTERKLLFVCDVLRACARMHADAERAASTRTHTQTYTRIHYVSDKDAASRPEVSTSVRVSGTAHTHTHTHALVPDVVSTAAPGSTVARSGEIYAHARPATVPDEFRAWEFLSDAVAVGRGAVNGWASRKRQALLDGAAGREMAEALKGEQDGQPQPGSPSRLPIHKRYAAGEELAAAFESSTAALRPPHPHASSVHPLAATAVWPAGYRPLLPAQAPPPAEAEAPAGGARAMPSDVLFRGSAAALSGITPITSSANSATSLLSQAARDSLQHVQRVSLPKAAGRASADEAELTGRSQFLPRSEGPSLVPPAINAGPTASACQPAATSSQAPEPSPASTASAAAPDAQAPVAPPAESTATSTPPEAAAAAIAAVISSQLERTSSAILSQLGSLEERLRTLELRQQQLAVAKLQQTAAALDTTSRPMSAFPPSQSRSAAAPAPVEPMRRSIEPALSPALAAAQPISDTEASKRAGILSDRDLARAAQARSLASPVRPVQPAATGPSAVSTSMEQAYQAAMQRVSAHAPAPASAATTAVEAPSRVSHAPTEGSSTLSMQQDMGDFLRNLTMRFADTDALLARARAELHTTA